MTGDTPDNTGFSEPPPPLPPITPPLAPPPVYDARAYSPSGLSIAAFVLGLLSFVGCGPCFGLPALVVGLMELQNIKNNISSREGRAFALTGAILGGISIALLILVVGFYVVLIVFFILIEVSGGNL